MNRREFLKSSARSVGSLFGLSLLSSFLGCRPDSKAPASTAEFIEMNVGSVSELEPGEGQSFKLGSRPTLIIRDETGELLAYDATCPHMECTVHYRPEKRDIFCPCHSGTFDLAGQKIFGPPDKPLTPLQVRVEGDQILVTKTKAEQR